VGLRPTVHSGRGSARLFCVFDTGSGYLRTRLCQLARDAHAQPLAPINTRQDGAQGLILHDTVAFTPEGTPLGGSMSSAGRAKRWAGGDAGKGLHGSFADHSAIAVCYLPTGSSARTRQNTGKRGLPLRVRPW
jgi:hypothetical protein